MVNVELIKKEVFNSRETFEKYILDINNDADREDVISILSDRIIRILLKEELNFLYMKDFNNFRFTLIVNILFKEFTNEWLIYAQEYLSLSQEEAVEYVQDKTRLQQLLKIVKWYFTTYKKYFVQEIADTFIELVDSMSQVTMKNDLIEIVLESDFVKKGTLSIVYTYNQLWTRVKSAHNVKNEKISKIQIQIYEAIESKNDDKMKKLEYESALLSETSLAAFDDSVMRVRNTMVEYMLGIDSFKD